MISKPQWRRLAKSHIKSVLSSTSSDHLQRQFMALHRTSVTSLKGTWATYLALADEIDISPSVAEGSQVEWVYPYVALSKSDKHMEFRKLTDRSAFFEKSDLGFLQPPLKCSVVIDLSEIDGIFLPALMLDSSGTRLGRGQGYYDHTLQGFRGQKIGICLDVNFIDSELPREEHDVVVDEVWTETRSYKCVS